MRHDIPSGGKDSARDTSMNERRKPRLGRTVPGMSPRLQRRLKHSFAITQRVSPRLAGRLALELFLTPPKRKIDAVDVPTLGLAKRSMVPVNGGNVATYEWGDAGPAVLLLHGWGSHAARFGSFVEPLLGAGFRVLAADAPGHGESSGRQSDLPQFRDALKVLLQERGPVHGIVAHSLGAGATILLLADWQPRDLRSLVMFGVPRDIDYVMESFAAVIGLDVQSMHALRTSFERRFRMHPNDFSAPRLAPKIPIPALVVHDQDDEIAPFEHGEELLRALPRAELHRTTGLGHSGALRDAATISRVVEFLRS
jgi:pimeloyl-ACP methyl ester carboxylesterase